MRLAFLADIHGNLPALEAVVEDLKKQTPDAVYLVGDQINRCPWSNEVLDLVNDMGWQGIYGNHELVIRRLSEAHEPIVFDNRQRFPDLWWTLKHLSMDHLNRVRQLPAELRLDFGDSKPIRLIHGIPGNPFRGIFLDTETSEIVRALDNVDEPYIVCGHTHHPLRRCVNGVTVLNGGSVGIPYNGDPRAQYLLLTASGDTWTPLYRRVRYPVHVVQEAFQQFALDREFGPLAAIHLRTVVTAQPWSSDFGHWLNLQTSELQKDVHSAVRLYEQSHGPGNWSFFRE